ncbi:hypothetical protein V6N13_137077 [Hibiscus sabdariffa]
MAAYGGYTYNGSYTTTDQVANGKQKPIMSYNSKGDTNGWCWPDTKSETVVEQLCVYKYTQSSSSVKVVEASRDYGHVEGKLNLEKERPTSSTDTEVISNRSFDLYGIAGMVLPPCILF